MNAEVVINKVVITEEAIFDYDSIVGQPFPKADIKNECEEYIVNMQSFGRLLQGYYFRANYTDATGKILMLFFYKGIRLGTMQMWKLCGICEAEDLTAELEEDGLIRSWLNSRIVDLPKEIDWVEWLRLYEEESKKRMEAGYD